MASEEERAAERAFTPRPDLSAKGAPVARAPAAPPPAASAWPAVAAAALVAVVTGSFYLGTHKAAPRAPDDAAPAASAPAAETAPVPLVALAPPPRALLNAAPAAPAASSSGLLVEAPAGAAAPGGPAGAAIDQSFSQGYTPAPAGLAAPTPTPAGGEEDLVPLQDGAGAAQAAKPMPQVHLEPTAPMVDPEKEARTTAFAPAAQNPAQAPAAKKGAVLRVQVGPGRTPAGIQAMLQQMMAQVQQAQQAQQAQARRNGPPAAGPQVAFGGAGTPGTLVAQAPTPLGAGAAAPVWRAQDPAAMGRAVGGLVSPVGRSVTIYLAPWCGYCRRGVAQFRQMRDDLRLKGIKAQIVVGSAPHDQLVAFAQEIGPGVVIDDRRSNPLGGVPAFFLADSGTVRATHLGIFDSAAQGEDWALSH